MVTERTIEAGQTYQAGDGSARSPRWRILSVAGDTANAVRVRKVDGQIWTWDTEPDASRDFPVGMIAERWTLVR